MTDHKDDIVEVPPEVFETYSLEEKAKANASVIEEDGEMPTASPVPSSEGISAMKFRYRNGSYITFFRNEADGHLIRCEYENIGFKRLGKALWFYPLKRS